MFVLNAECSLQKFILKTRNRADEISLPAVDKQIAHDVINLIQKGLRGELPNQRNTERIYLRQITASNTNTSSVNHSTDSNDDDLYLRLEKLSDLKQKGALSDSEFQVLKNDLLKKISGRDLSSISSTSDIDVDTLNATSNLSVDNDFESNYKTCHNSKPKYQNALTSIYCQNCGKKL